MISQSILNQKIQEHELWLESSGAEGTQLILLNEILEDLDFQEGNLKQATFNFCNFNECCFNNINLENSIIMGCSFKSCSMEKINFEISKISQTSFKEDVLNKSKFKGAVLESCTFSECYLDCCDLSSDEPSETESYLTTYLYSNNFLNSFLRSCQFNYSVFTLKNNFSNCDFTSSDFGYASVQDTNLSENSFNCCILNSTNFAYSNFKNSTFGSSNMDWDSIWSFCIGNQTKLLTIHSSLFDFINITDERIFFSDIVDTKENWFKTLTDEEIVDILAEKIETSPEEILKWWNIMKPVLMSICNYNIDN